jgi:hypothetical protein
MSILAQDVANRIRFALDAEGADHYDDTLDIIPAINASQEWLVSVINASLSRKKLGEEIFRDLIKTRVFQTNTYSRIALDPTLLGHEVWTILALYPKPTVAPTAATVACSASNIFTDADNGTMESDITGLNTSTGDTIAKSTDQAFAGSFSTKYTTGAQTSSVPLGRKMIGTDTGVAITKGLTYEISARVYVPSGQTLDTPSPVTRRDTQIRISADPTGAGIFSSESIVLGWRVSINNYDEWVEIKTKATASASGSAFPAIGQSLWLLAAGGIVYTDNITVTCVTSDEDSIYFDNVSYISSDYSAKRLTLEEWNEGKGNPFQAGNTIVDLDSCPEVVEYAYLGWNDYTSLNYNVPTSRETEVRPLLNQELVAIAYVKMPTTITSLTEYLEFPQSLTNLITEKALNYIAYKQGDQTNIFGVTTADISTLLQTI